MENNLFDKELKKMLEGLEVPFEGKHWADMANRLKETKVRNESDSLNFFDQTILHKIKGFEMPFNESNWIALRQRLLANAYLKKWILHTKVLESLTMVLLAFALVQTIQPKKVPIAQYQGPIASVNGESKGASSSSINSGDIVIQDNPVLGDNEVGLVQLVQKTPKLVNFIDRETIELKHQQNQLLTLNRQPISFLEFARTLVLDLDEPDVHLPRIDLKVPVQSTLGLSVYGVLQIDHTLTGPDEIYNIDVPNVWSPGYGGGVALTKQIGSLIYTAGLEYQEIKYAPTPIVLVSKGNAALGYVGSGTSTVELSLAKVPLTVGYAFVDNKRHQFSLNVGITTGIGSATFQQSTYVLASHTKKNKTELQAKAIVGNQSSTYTKGSGETKNKLLQSHSPSVQFFAYANANIGYELKLNKSHSLFAKANYQHQISKKGIGLPNDKVHSVGLHFGLKAYL